MAATAPTAPTATETTTARGLLVAAAGAQVGLTVVLVHPSLVPFDPARPNVWLPLTAPLYLLAVVGLARAGLRRGTAVAVVVGLTAVLQLIAITHSPLTSNDDLRYIWDAKVQLAGVDPYRYAPDAPQLDRLHEPLLFAAQGGQPHGCSLLNRPSAHTIYPPVAQAAFVAVRLLSAGGHGGQLPYQVAAALGVLAVAGLLVRRATRRGEPVWPVAVWGWSPVVVSEYGNNAHIDWLAVLLSIAGVGAYVAAHPRWAGALVGAAIATKLYPALLLPSMLRRHPTRVLVAAAAVVGVGYVPHVAAVGGRVVGYLPGYLDEEGYSSGSRLLLLGWVLPHPYDTAMGALLLLGLAVLAYRRSDPDRPELTAVWLVGSAFLVATPNYGWYAGLLVVLVALTRCWEWLPVAFAPTCTYLYGGTHDRSSFVYLVAALLAATIAYVRFVMQPTGVTSTRAADHIRRHQLLDRALPGRRGRVVEPADRARRVPGRHPLRRLPGPAGDLPQHPDRAPQPPGRARRAGAGAVPGPSAALGVPPHREGARPVARGDGDAPVG